MISMDEGMRAQLQADLHDAVSKVISKYEGGPTYLTRFVALAEVVDAEGGRAVWTVAADGMMRWDTLGLLEYARSVENAATFVERGGG